MTKSNESPFVWLTEPCPAEARVPMVAQVLRMSFSGSVDPLRAFSLHGKAEVFPKQFLTHPFERLHSMESLQPVSAGFALLLARISLV